MSSCLNCNTDLKSNTSSAIHCDVCQGPLHLKCVGLSESDVKLTRARSKAIKVVCNSCSINMSQFKDIKTIITTIQNELTTSINQLKAEFESQLQELKATLTMTQQQTPSYVFEEVVNEVMERQRRTKNLVIFGVVEPPSDSSREEAALHDSGNVYDILANIVPEYRNDDLKIQRLGRHTSNRNRPIKIALRNEQEVINFIRNAKRLRSSVNYKNVFISSDRTPRQIKLFNQLKEELNIRRTNGETGLKIRHFQGVPKIVKDNLN